MNAFGQQCCDHDERKQRWPVAWRALIIIGSSAAGWIWIGALLLRL